MIVGFVMIVAGLALLVYSDPALSAVVIGQSASTASATTPSGSTGFAGGFSPGGGFSFTPGAGTTTTASRASSVLSTDSIAENSAGFGLAAVGVILAVVGTRTRRS